MSEKFRQELAVVLDRTAKNYESEKAARQRSKFFEDSSRSASTGEDLEARIEKMFELGSPETVLRTMDMYSGVVDIQASGCGFFRNAADGENRESRKEKLFELGCPERVTKAMDMYSGVVAIQESGCYFFASATIGENGDSRREKMFKIGCPERVVKAMDIHSGVELIQEAGCIFFQNTALGENGDSRAEKMFEIGCPERVIKAMHMHSYSAAIQESGCYCFQNANIGENRESRKEKMFELGCPEKVMKAMEMHSGVVAIQDAGCKFFHLALRGENGVARAEKMFELGCPERMVKAMDMHSGVEVQQAGCFFFMTALIGENNESRKEKMFELGCPERVMKAMEMHSGVEVIQQAGCNFFQQCAMGGENAAARAEKMFELGCPERVVKAMDIHSGVEVQEGGCYFFQNTALGENMESRKEKMFELGCPERVMKAMDMHSAEVDIQEVGCNFFMIALIGDNSESRTEKLFEIGCPERVMKAMDMHSGAVELQKIGCYFFHSVTTKNNLALPEKMLDLGCLETILRAFEQYPDNTEIAVSSFVLLAFMASGLQQGSRTIMDSHRLNLVSVALASHPRSAQVGSPCLALLRPLLRKGSLLLQETKSVVQVEMIVQTAFVATHLFVPAAACLCAWDQDIVEVAIAQCPEVDKLQQIRLCSLVSDLRYSMINGAKDVFFVLMDMGLDVANLYSLVRQKQWKWSTSIGLAMACNGVLTGIGALENRAYYLALTNWVTMGAGGLIHAAYCSWRDGCKHQNVMKHKAIEGLESKVSFMVTSDTVLVAGHMTGLRPLSSSTAGLRWCSIASSCFLLPLIALDVDKQQVYQNHADCGKWAAYVSLRGNQVMIFLFHASEIIANLVLVLVTFVSGAHSLIAVVLIGTFWFTVLVCVFSIRVHMHHKAMGWEFPAKRTIQAGFQLAPIFSTFNLLGYSDMSSLQTPCCPKSHPLCEVDIVAAGGNLGYMCSICAAQCSTVFYYCPTCNWGMCPNCFRNTAPSSSRRFEFDVAVLKPCLWVLAWGYIFWQVYAEEKIRNDFLKYEGNLHIMCLTLLAMIAFVLYVPFAVCQARAGRWHPDRANGSYELLM